MQKKTLYFDLSKKTPAEIAEFLSALLAAKCTLQQKGLTLKTFHKTHQVSLNKYTLGK